MHPFTQGEWRGRAVGFELLVYWLRVLCGSSLKLPGGRSWDQAAGLTAGPVFLLYNQLRGNPKKGQLEFLCYL